MTNRGAAAALDADGVRGDRAGRRYAAASKEDAEKYFAADWPSYGTQCMAVNLDGTDVDAGDGNTWSFGRADISQTRRGDAAAAT